MASSSRQTGSTVRNVQNSRSYRPSQRLLTSDDISSPITVVGRKRVIVKQEDALDDPPVISRSKFEPDGRANHTAKPREIVDSSYDKPTSSNYWTERSFEYEDEEEEDCDAYYDQLPPRLSNTPKIVSPSKPEKKLPISIVNMGKSVVTGRKDNITQEIDMQHLIEKYVNSESQKESEAWLINIGLSEKLNSVTQEIARLRSEMSEMWQYFQYQLQAKDGIKDRLTMQTPWPGTKGKGPSYIMPTPFGASPAPNPPNDRDFIVPPIYAKIGVDCRDIYNEIQRKGKKRPGVVFLTHFIRDLCAVGIEPPHKFVLTIRSKNRKDDLVNLSPNFIKPIERFFLAACNVKSGLTYALGDMLREAIAHELRELRRAPRKEKLFPLNDKMMKVLRDFGAHRIPLLDDENGDHNEEREEAVEEEEDRQEDDDNLVMEEDEVEVDDDA